PKWRAIGRRCSCVTAVWDSTPNRSVRTGTGCRIRFGAESNATAVAAGYARVSVRAPSYSWNCRCGRTGGHDGGGRMSDGGGLGTRDSEPVSVFLVDDHALFRAGVRGELETLSDSVRVAGEAGSVGEAVAGIAGYRPQVVLLDVHMPDGGGSEVIRRVLPEMHDVVFLALSVSDAAEDVISVIRAGARGYVTKTISSQELVAAVSRVAD